MEKKETTITNIFIDEKELKKKLGIKGNSRFTYSTYDDSLDKAGKRKRTVRLDFTTNEE